MMRTHPELAQRIIANGEVARKLAKTVKFNDPEFADFFMEVSNIMGELITTVQRQDKIIELYQSKLA